MNCQYCGRVISGKEETCPHCGAPVDAAYSGFDAQGTAEAILETCPDCGGQVSPRAPVCPHCGAPRGNAAAFAQMMIKRDWGFEWRTSLEIFGWPLIHVAFGRKNGKLRVAKGIIAIGQFAIGLFTLAQFGVGFIFGFGQFIFGCTTIAQFAIGIAFGLGQFATGYVAIGQFALGVYALGQVAIGLFTWTPEHCHPEARRFFTELLERVKHFIGE